MAGLAPRQPCSPAAPDWACPGWAPASSPRACHCLVRSWSLICTTVILTMWWLPRDHCLLQHTGTSLTPALISRWETSSLRWRTRQDNHAVPWPWDTHVPPRVSWPVSPPTSPPASAQLCPTLLWWETTMLTPTWTLHVTTVMMMMILATVLRVSRRRRTISWISHILKMIFNLLMSKFLFTRLNK